MGQRRGAYLQASAETRKEPCRHHENYWGTELKMKTLLRILAMLVLTAVMFSLTECNPNDDRVADNEDTEEAIAKERDEISEDLKELRKDLDIELEKINRRL